MTAFAPIPRSARTGIGWPAIPSYRDAAALVLLDQLEASQWWPAEQLLAHQLRQIESLLAHAWRTTPVYQDRLRVLSGLKTGGLTLEAWRRIPLLLRIEVREAGPRLSSRLPPKDHGEPIDVTTSGSTGLPVTVKATTVTGLFFAALHLRYHRWHERDLTATVANIRRLKGKQAKLASSETAVPWATVYGTGRMVFLDFRSPVEEQLAWLARHRPHYLLTYPSNLRALLAHPQARRLAAIGLRGVVTQSEVLESDLRTVCEAQWGVKVTDSYSSQEVGLIALQCPEHPHYHVQSESVLVEVLDDNGAPCRPGRIGRVFVTDLHNFAAPLIRYELGDWAEVGNPCPCGRGLPVLARIVGRTYNRLTLPSGEKIWAAFNPVFVDGLAKAFPSFLQGQLIQRSRSEIEVKTVLGRPATPAEEEAARAALSRVLSPAFIYRFVYVDEIPRPPSGKISPIVSEIEG